VAHGSGFHWNSYHLVAVFQIRPRFNWIFHFGQAPRYAKDMKVIQLDIAPEEIGHNKATEVALVGPRVGPQARPRTGSGKAIPACAGTGQLNKALAGRQWFHPKDTPWRQMITKKATENAAMIAPQIADDEAPANYYRALKDVAAWMPKNAFLSAEGAGTMDIGLTQLPSFNARSCLNAGTYGTMGVGLGQAIAACVVHPDRPVIHLSGDSAIGFSGMEMETLVRYNFPCKIVVLNNGGIGPGMHVPEIPDNRVGASGKEKGGPVYGPPFLWRQASIRPARRADSLGLIRIPACYAIPAHKLSSASVPNRVNIVPAGWRCSYLTKS
jgi:2-hydroxyacyl-CoA lyase 1